ncbi:MAG: alpha-E domain-containing protein [bacterium]|nr:alpha-E domain-containing protein [Acidimicrobiia bacterium]MCY4650943.1 alpha-E domain-containing protein [bacterium]
MLSRSAAGLYWMGRYLERASHLSRLLKQQTESLVDSPPRDIYFGWHRIYGALEREPVSGALQLDSIRSCFVQGRENARQMRHHISAEMWTCLNQSYLRIQNMEIQDIWPRSPENFYAETATQIDTFRGVTSSTLYRDDAWHFVQLGNYVERLQLSSSLLMAQIAAVRLFEVPADAYWTSLLRHYHAFEAYNRASSAAIEPDRVLGLLVTNPQLPDSLSLSVSELCNELTAIGRGPDAEATARTRSQAEDLRQLVGIEWSGGTDAHALLRRIRNECRQLHHLVTKTYLDYPVLAPANGRAGGHDQ